MEEEKKESQDEKKVKKIKHTYQTSIAERISYGVYFTGQNLIYFLVVNFLMIFYTDEILIPAAAVSILMLVTKVWDAINDPIFGFIVDKVKFKKGKFLPWIKIAAVLSPVATFLVFLNSVNFSMPVRVIFAFVTYLLWDLAYTISDVPVFALTTVMTDNIKERTSLITYGRIAAMFGVMFIMVAGPILVGKIGYRMLALIVSILGGLTMLPLLFVGKERFNVENDNEEKEEGLGIIFEYLKGNKYLLIFYAATCLHGIFKVALGNYVAKYNFGSIELGGIFALAAIPAIFLSYVFIPFLSKKYDKIVIYRYSVIATIVLSVITYIVGYKNIPIYLGLSFLRAIPEGILGVLMFTFAADTVEYGEYKTGIRKEGITFSIQTFTAKFTAGVATAVSALVLVFLSYNGAVEAQPDHVIKGFWFASNLVPALGALISLPLLFKYNLRDKDVQVMADINTGKLTREEGDKLLTGKY